MKSRQLVKVYGIYSKCDNRLVYVGQTTLILKQRYNYHTCANSLMGHAIRELGKDAFYISLIKEVSDDLVDAVEVDLILKNETLKPNGYNAILASHRNGGIGRELWKNPSFRESQTKLFSKKMTEKHSENGFTESVLKNAWEATREKRRNPAYMKNIGLKLSKVLKDKYEKDPEYRERLLKGCQISAQKRRENPELTKRTKERVLHNRK